MLIEVLKSKIHRARVTCADLNYVGSITIDADLMDGAGLVAGERVFIADVDNGERFDTYVIRGERGSGVIGVNGAAARKVQVGDRLIVMAYCHVTPDEARELKPMVVFPDETTNRLV